MRAWLIAHGHSPQSAGEVPWEDLCEIWALMRAGLIGNYGLARRVFEVTAQLDRLTHLVPRWIGGTRAGLPSPPKLAHADPELWACMTGETPGEAAARETNRRLANFERYALARERAGQ